MIAYRDIQTITVRITQVFGSDSLQFANTCSILHVYEKQGFGKFYPADITLYTSPVGIVDRRGRRQILESTFAKSLHFANIYGCSILSLSLRKLPLKFIIG